MNKNKIQCSGIKEDSGERCRLRTDDSSGYCHKHREQLNKETEYALMKCRNCPITTCTYTDKGPGGLCFFELADNVKDFDEQWKIYQAMKDQLKFNRLMLNRFEREITRRNLSDMGTKGDTTSLLLKQYNNLMAINGGQVVAFGKFMGYQATKSSDDKVKDRKEKMEKIFAREKQKDKDQEEDKEAEEIATV